MTSIHELDLDIPKTYLHTNNKRCRSMFLKVKVEQDIQTRIFSLVTLTSTRWPYIWTWPTCIPKMNFLV